MIHIMENRVYPDNIILQLYESYNGTKYHPRQFVLKSCIGSGAMCVAYNAEGEDGIPVKLKQLRPRGVRKESERYKAAEQRFIHAYKQQITLMKNEKTAAVTAGLYGLYQDDNGYYWTSVSSMVGRTFDKLLSENSFQKNLEVIRRIAESIKAYHEAGWILLDVKPENILVIDSLGLHGINFFDFDSFIQLSEVESAIIEESSLVLSSSEGFSAPELLEPSVELHEVGITVDFYSIGALLFSAVFTKRPGLYDCLPNCEYDFSKTEGVEKLSVTAQNALTSFFRHTLTLSSAGRFKTDDEVLAELDHIIETSFSKAPRMIKTLPHAVSTFKGREKEKEALMKALESSAAPIYISGVGGIGKTQLVLKVAEDLKNEFDFYYVPFQGSVKETILSLPMENLSIENESGLMVEKSLDEQYKIILSVLRNEYSEKTVLIVDNFDAPNDEDTPSLRYDQNFADMESLPLRLIITSRCVFEEVHTLKVGNLGEDAVVDMLSEAFPGENRERLLELADATGRHTLTLSIIAGTVKESKGRLNLNKVLAELSGESGQNRILTQLSKVFKASKMSKVARSVMACACLFPQRGITSDILIRLFSQEQWTVASQLERSGWLRFDNYSNLWSVHPIAKAVCISEKSTSINWENAGGFVTELRKSQQLGFFDELSEEERAQINELFGNVGRYQISKPLPWKKICAAVFAIAAIGCFCIFKPDQSPFLTVEILPEQQTSVNGTSYDTDKVVERLKQFGIKKISVNDTTGEVTGKTHLSRLGEINSIEDSLHYIMKYPGELFAIGSGTHQWEYEPIPRKCILSASVKTGSIPELTKAKKEETGMELTGDYPYLYLVLDDEGENILNSLRERIDDSLTFALDFDQYEDYMQFAFTFPGEEKNSYCIIGGSWGSEAVYKAIAASLTQEELKERYVIRTIFDPAAIWEDPQELSDGARGKFQKQIGEVEQRSVIFFYDVYSPETVSDYTFSKVLLEMKQRLDILGVPYAIGTDHFEGRKIAVCMDAEKTGYDIISTILPGCSFSIKASYKHEDSPTFFSSGFSAEVSQNSRGSYVLLLKAKDEEYKKQLLATTTNMLADNDNHLFLTITGPSGSFIKIASAVISEPIDDGVIVLDQLPFLSTEEVTEEHVSILHLLADIANSEYTELSHYRFNKEHFFSSDEVQFGILRDLAQGKSILEKINHDFYPAEAWRNDERSASDDTIYVHLNGSLGPEMGETAAEMIETIFTDCEMDSSDVDSFYFYLLDEREDRLCRVIIRKAGSADSVPSRYIAHAVLVGDEVIEYAQEIKEAFTSRELFRSMGFYAEKAVFINAGRGISAEVI